MKLVGKEGEPEPLHPFAAWVLQNVPPPAPLAWLDVALLPQVHWIDGAPAPLPQLVALLASKKSADGAILQTLADQLEASSLSHFVWKVFDIWQSQPKPPKGSRWVADALARFGDESAMVRLAQLVREWTKRRRYAQIRTAIEVFAANDTAMAVSQLGWLTGAGPTPAIRRLATDKLGEIADANGSSVEDLLDAAPTLGLSSTGEWACEVKGQRFLLRVQPDFSLSIRDPSGKVRKSMPKSPSDRPDLLPFSMLRKQVHALAAQHSARLEQAMIAERTWPADRWRTLFLEHPLLRLLTQRIVWTSLSPQGQETTYRVAEDFTFADERDELLVLPEDAQIRVAHPLFWSETTRLAWTRIFEDYHIASPFEQAGRATFSPTHEELSKTAVDRCAGCPVDSRVLMDRLRRSGWRAGPAVMGPITFAHYRQFAGCGLTAALHHEGVYLVRGAGELEVRLGEIAFARTSEGPFDGHGLDPRNRVPLGSVPSIPFSEVLRDIDRVCRRQSDATS